jgi:hypothetical protein
MRRHRCGRVLLALTGCIIGLAGCTQRTATLDPGQALAADQQVANEDKALPGEPGKGNSEAGDGFHFPADHGGQLLGNLLLPSGKVSPVDDRPAPRRFPDSPAVEAPQVPVPPSPGDLVRLPEPKASQPARPGPLPEGLPLLSYKGTPQPPEASSLPAGVLVRLPSPDVNRPVPLPLLGDLAPDRAPFDDPTAEHSLATALAAQMPERTNPAPFLRLTLPDPFENRQTVRLRTLPAEESTPIAAAPRGPKP